MIDLRKHSLAALGYFVLVAILGTFLRLYYVPEIDLSFLRTNSKFLTHAHSHTALLGWIYLGLTTLIYKIYLEKALKAKIYRRIFIVTNIAAIGMFLTFPINGYAPLSISFSTLYLLSSYAFSWFFFKYSAEEDKDCFSWKMLRAAIFYLLLSSLGTWAIGPITVTVGAESFWHNDSLYFFLHFLYSGFFFLSLIGILFFILEEDGVKLNKQYFHRLYQFLNTGIILSYFLSVLWANPPFFFYIVGIVGALIQIIGYYYLYKILKPHFKVFEQLFGKFFYKLLIFAGCLLFIRITLQFFSGFPYFVDLAFRFKDFIIGYLHMVFLGIIVPVMFTLLQYFKLIDLSKTGLSLFLLAFFTTELLIFYRGFAGWLGLPFFESYYSILAAFTLLLPDAILMIFLKNFGFAFKKGGLEVQ